LRHTMVRYRDDINYIRLYKEKEQAMLNASMRLARNFDKANNSLNPHLADNLNAQQNIYGCNMKKSEEKASQVKIIQPLTNRIDIFAFREDNCPHRVQLSNDIS